MKKSIRNQNHLILGAAGALGYGHVKALLERGAQVTVLVRSAERAHVLFGEHENLECSGRRQAEYLFKRGSPLSKRRTQC